MLAEDLTIRSDVKKYLHDTRKQYEKQKRMSLVAAAVSRPRGFFFFSFSPHFYDTLFSLKILRSPSE